MGRSEQRVFDAQIWFTGRPVILEPESRDPHSLGAALFLVRLCEMTMSYVCLALQNQIFGLLTCPRFGLSLAVDHFCQLDAGCQKLMRRLVASVDGNGNGNENEMHSYERRGISLTHSLILAIFSFASAFDLS